MRFDAIIDLYQKGNLHKVLRYENDLQFLTISYEINWHISGKHQKNFSLRTNSGVKKMVEIGKSRAVIHLPKIPGANGRIETNLEFLFLKFDTQNSMKK